MLLLPCSAARRQPICTDWRERIILCGLQAPSVQTVAVFENERYMPLIGWSTNNLMPTDRRRFSGPNRSDTTSFPNVPLEPGTPRGVRLPSHVAH